MVHHFTLSCRGGGGCQYGHCSFVNDGDCRVCLTVTKEHCDLPLVSNTMSQQRLHHGVLLSRHRMRHAASAHVETTQSEYMSGRLLIYLDLQWSWQHACRTSVPPDFNDKIATSFVTLVHALEANDWSKTRLTTPDQPGTTVFTAYVDADTP